MYKSVGGSCGILNCRGIGHSNGVLDSAQKSTKDG